MNKCSRAASSDNTQFSRRDSVPSDFKAQVCIINAKAVVDG